MLLYTQIVGNQQDWAKFVTNVEMLDTPFLDWLPTGDKPVNVELRYQVESFRDPVENSHINGTPVSGFLSAGENRAMVRALVHYMSKGAGSSTLQQEVTDIAGVRDDLAREIAKVTKELSRDMEAHFLDSLDHREGTTVQGYKTRSVGSWLSNAAQALYPVDESARPPAASISTTATASLTENVILDVLESMGRVTKSSKLKTGFVGPRLKRAFNNMPRFTPLSALVGGTPTGSTGIVYTKDLSKREISSIMERYHSDYGYVDLVISHFLAYFSGTDIEKLYTGFFLHQDMWEMRWNKQPEWIKKAYEGGAMQAFCEAIMMLVCKNPKGEGKYAPTT